MRRRARALLVLAALVPFSCGLDPGGEWTGGDSTGGGSLPGSSGSLGSLTPGDGGSDGGALGGGEGTVRGDALVGCGLFTYACPTGTTCALYGAIDPLYSALYCGPVDLCSIVTCPSLKRCVVGSGTPPSLSCQ